MSSDAYGNYYPQVESAAEVYPPDDSGSGAESPYTKTSHPTDSPFVFTAETRTVVEVYYFVDSTGDAALITLARTGVPTVTAMRWDTPGPGNGSFTFVLSPGDTATVTASTTGGSASCEFVHVITYEE